MKKLIIMLFLFFWVSPLWGATYWVNPDGTETDNTAKATTSLLTIASGITHMAASGNPGDILMVADGTYTENISVTSSGSAVDYIYYQAETVGGVTVDGSLTAWSNTITVGGDYNKFVGFRFVRGGDYTAEISSTASHTYFSQCFFSHAVTDSADYAYAEVIDSGGTYTLIEDCWVVGGARYLINDQGGQYNIYRRVVGRWDWTMGTQPIGGFFNYHDTGIAGGSDAVYQNCIAIDFNVPTGHTGYMTGAFADKYGNNVTRVGCIAYGISGDNSNSQSWVAVFDESDSDQGNVGTNNNSDIVIINSSSGYRFIRGGRSNVSEISFFNNDYAVGYMNAANTITNSLFYSNTSQTTASVTYSYGHFYDEATQGTNYTSGASGTLYPVRIETGSALDGTGSGDADRGAEILKKIGTTGAHYSDTGWDTLTSDNLWPWENEALIKTDFSSVASIPSGVFPTTNTATRGFCSGTSEDGSSQTLTKYIWEALGNEIPADIYGNGSVTFGNATIESITWE